MGLGFIVFDLHFMHICHARHYSTLRTVHYCKRRRRSLPWGSTVGYRYPCGYPATLIVLLILTFNFWTKVYFYIYCTAKCYITSVSIRVLDLLITTWLYIFMSNFHPIKRVFMCNLGRQLVCIVTLSRCHETHTSRWWCQQSSTVQLYGRTSIDLTEYSDEVPDSSLGTTSPDHQAVSPKCLLNTTCYLCKKEENIFVLPSCLRWLRGNWRQFLLRSTVQSLTFYITDSADCHVKVTVFSWSLLNIDNELIFHG